MRIANNKSLKVCRKLTMRGLKMLCKRYKIMQDALKNNRVEYKCYIYDSDGKYYPVSNVFIHS